MPFTTGWALGGHLLRVENQVWARVREEEQFLAIESQRFGQPGNVRSSWRVHEALGKELKEIKLPIWHAH
jgi:hypothetical protein